MSHQDHKILSRLSPLMAFLLCSTAALPALAADPGTSTAPPAAAASSNPTVNLIHLLVERGVLSQADADELIKQANREAAATAPPRAVAPTAATTTAVPAAAAGAAPTGTASDGTISVPYVPEIVKQQLRDEIKQDVLTEAQQENWAAPNQIPDWVKNIHIYGDIRARYEGNFFPSGNDTAGDLVNFNSINTGSPYLADPTANPHFPPLRDTDSDRDYYRLRARLGVDAILPDGFSTGLRIATGQDDQPVSENQTIGYANNGQGGDFSKYAIWIDRAFIRYDLQYGKDLSFNAEIGRFDNPFFSTNMIWWDDLGFDGLAFNGKYQVYPGVTPFLTVGAFPVFNTELNFGTTNTGGAGFASENKWLYAVQAGTDWKINNDYTAKVAAAYYFFQNMQGRLSSPCTVLSSADSCDTDDTRPSWAQYGNTYMPLRQIIPATGTDPLANNYQFYGLATPFHELAATARLDYSHFDPLHMWVTGEFVENLAFHWGEINEVAVNNLGGTCNLSTCPPGQFAGGNTGYFINYSIGSPVLKKLWDWNASFGYRYIESDAVVDAFNDPDFGLGGTNLKGYTIGGNLALTPNVWTSVRWMSADSIAGPPFSVDVLMVDLTAKF
jgi:hypothetical protein